MQTECFLLQSNINRFNMDTCLDCWSSIQVGYNTAQSKCPGALFPSNFPGEKIGAKSIPGQAVNLPGAKRITSETSERNLRNDFHLETVPRQ